MSRRPAPLLFLVLLLTAALTALVPLSVASGAAPAGVAKKKKKKLKCKKGYTKKTVTKTVKRKTAKGKTVKVKIKVKKCVKTKKKKQPAATPTPTPTPTDPLGMFTGTTDQGLAITVTRTSKDAVNLQATVAMTCENGTTFNYAISQAISTNQSNTFTTGTTGTSTTAGRSPANFGLKGTFNGATVTGTIDRLGNSQCPSAAPIGYGATIK